MRHCIGNQEYGIVHRLGRIPACLIGALILASQASTELRAEGVLISIPPLPERGQAAGSSGSIVGYDSPLNPRPSRQTAQRTLLPENSQLPGPGPQLPAPVFKGAPTPLESETQTTDSATSDNQSDEVLFSADEVAYDERLDAVRATGNVEIVEGERVLRADEVIYNQRTGKVQAIGNVSIVDTTGDVLFASFANLEEEMASGVIRDMRMRLSDDSRFAAAGAQRIGGRVTEMRKAVYSPCELCKDDPDEAPIWQLKADRIVHDQVTKDVEYYDAFLEIFGIPVVYTPYLTHPDPSVKRRSGFLVPRFGNSQELGFLFRIPYYFVIDDSMDTTVEPLFMTDQGLILAAEVRKRFSFGNFEVFASGGFVERPRDDGSGLSDDGRFRGHVFAKADVSLDENWRASAKYERASDDTYLRRFDFSSESVLETEARLEGFHKNSYTRVEFLDFQGLRDQDSREQTPGIAPRIDYEYLSDPDGWGGRARFQASTVSLGRDDGADSRRLSVGAGWHLPLLLSHGSLIDFDVSLRADGYQYSELEVSDTQEPSESGVSGRIYPQVAVQWRFPWVRHEEDVATVIEPTIQAVLAPNGGNPDDIPNEDSLAFELNDTNLMMANRQPGFDKIDGGTRISYGISASHVTPSYEVNGFIGQSYAFDPGTGLDDLSGASESLSDIVGRIRVNTQGYGQASYQFRLDNESFASRRHEVNLQLGPNEFRPFINYTFLDRILGGNTRALEEISGGFSSDFAENWSGSASVEHDLSEDETRRWRATVSYFDECIRVDGSFTQTFFQDRDIRPDNAFTVRVSLRNLGEFSSAF